MYMLPCVPQESSQNSSDIMPALMDLSDDEEAEAVGRPQGVCKSQVATMEAVLVSCFLWRYSGFLQCSNFCARVSEFCGKKHFWNHNDAQLQGHDFSD